MDEIVNQKLENNAISLGYIFRTIWGGRGIIVGGLIVGLALGIGAALMSTTRINAVTEYFISLPAISNGEYPNGVEFSPQDLVTPAVISRLNERTGLEDTEKFQENLTVEYSTPIADGLIKKYRNRLSARNLSSAEIDELNSAFTLELQQATSNTLRLALNHGTLGISGEVARDILISLPAIWSEVYTTQFRIIDDPRLPVQTVDWSGSVATPVGAVNADRTVGDIKFSLQVISSDSRMLALQTDSGETVFDLRKRVDNLLNLYISPILGSLLVDNEYVRTNFENYHMEAEELELRLEGLRRNIDDIRSVLNAQAFGQAASNGMGGEQLQIDRSAIDRIINLNNQVQYFHYLTQLFDKERVTIDKKALLQSRIRQISSVNQVNVRQLAEQAEPLLQSLVADYNDMLGAARELLRSQGTVLYRPLSAPIEVSSSPSRRIATIIAAYTFIALALSLLIIFVQSARRKPA